MGSCASFRAGIMLVDKDNKFKKLLGEVSNEIFYEIDNSKRVEFNIDEDFINFIKPGDKIVLKADGEVEI